ncbi:MAG: ROK family protein, partial [Acidimicrobiales bacterium]
MAPLPLPARALSRTVLAVDVGGSKLAAGLVDEAGALLGSASAPTPVGGDASAVWAALEEVVRSVLGTPEGRRPAACGVGCGGPMAGGGEEVSPLNIPGWRGFPLRATLAELTGVDTYVDNDAKALALAEGWRGTAAGRRDYLAMVVSTGVGGGVVLGGRLLDGRTGNAGHIGHVVVEPEGRACPCGGRGCLEAEASGTAIAAITGRGAAFAPPEIVTRAGTLVGRAVASVCALLDVDFAVVAGSVALGVGAPVFDAAQRELGARARLDYATRARIVPSELGADGPLVGAGAVAFRALEVGAPGAA